MHDFLSVFWPLPAIVLMLCLWWLLGAWETNLIIKVLYKLPFDHPDRPTWHQLQPRWSGFWYAWKFRKFKIDRVCIRCNAQLHEVCACEPYNDAHLICPKCDSTYNL